MRSEWLKLRTLRSSRYTLLSGLVLGAGTAAVFCRARAAEYERANAAARAAFDPASIPLLGGALFGQIAIGALGVLLVTSEYSTGMIYTSLTAVPRRGRLLAAKALVICLIGLVAGEVIGLASFLTGQAVLGAVSVPQASLTSVDAARAVLASGVYLSMVGVLGVAAGFLVRSTAAALVVLMMSTVVIPYLYGPFMPRWAQDLWPILAGMRTMCTEHCSVGLPWEAGLFVMCAGVGGALGAAYLAFRSHGP